MLIVLMGSCSSHDSQVEAKSENGVERNDNSVLKSEIPTDGLPVMLDFMADWCPPCRKMQPVVEQLEHKYQERVRVIQINVDENPAMASQFGVEAIPTFVFLDANGKEQSRLVGYQTEADIEKNINKIIN